MVNNYVICIVVIILIISIYYYFGKNENIKLEFNNQSIDKRLDDEHKEIFISLTKLYDACSTKWNSDIVVQLADIAYNTIENHWKTEDKYFDIGYPSKSPNHHNITQEIIDHKNAHTDTLNIFGKLCDNIKNKTISQSDAINNIQTIIKAIDNHINTMDVPHFSHWVKSPKLTKLLQKI